MELDVVSKIKKLKLDTDIIMNMSVVDPLVEGRFRRCSKSPIKSSTALHSMIHAIKYLKYKNKYLGLKNKLKIGGTAAVSSMDDEESSDLFSAAASSIDDKQASSVQKGNLLVLDFDETLGSFHINFSVYSKLLALLNIPNANIIRKKLLMYHIRPNLIHFFKELKKLKDENKIHKIDIMSRNSDRTSYGGYFKETIDIIEEITQTPKLIDEIHLNVFNKNLDARYGGKYEKYYIIDDKCEHVNPKEKCIPIEPYVSYIHYSEFINILREVGVDERIIKIIENELIQYSKNDFDESSMYSYVRQYPQIDEFKRYYEPKPGFPYQHYDDTELIRVLDIVQKIYV